MAPGQDGNSDTKERVPRDALFLFCGDVAGGRRIPRWKTGVPPCRVARDASSRPWKVPPPPHLRRVPVRRALFAHDLGTRRGRLL